MITYSRNIGRHVPLRDLPASELIELAQAYSAYTPAAPERTDAVFGVCAVWAELHLRRDMPYIEQPNWLVAKAEPARPDPDDIPF